MEEQNRGHYENALNFYLKAANIGPENPQIYNDIAIMYEHMGYPDRAEQYYLRIIKLDNRYVPAYANLAYLYLGQGQNEKAREFFLRRLNLSPRNDPWKGRILEELYKLDPQFKTRVIEQEMEISSRKLAEKAKKKAQADFSLAIERAEGHYKRGENFRVQKKYQQAIEEFDNALRVTPDNPKLVTARKMAEYEERIDEIKQTIGSATGHLNAGDVDFAKREFQHILAIIPKESVSNPVK